MCGGHVRFVIVRVLITGVAGFIGSTLAEHIVGKGIEVVGIDNFSDYYSRELKEANLKLLRTNENFKLIVGDINEIDLTSLMDGIEVVYHQAGQPGVRGSWSNGFEVYVYANILATQRLLEASRNASVRQFVYASSSSIYGNSTSPISKETDLPRPYSPYGVSKLAAEHLCNTYASNFGVNTVSLRYFTVYGPRQRPDMAIRRLIHSALNQQPFTVFGNGSQVRDFTFIDDVVAANVGLLNHQLPAGTVMNIAGGSSISLNELIEEVGKAVGRGVPVEYGASEAGDVATTAGDVKVVNELLKWQPQITVQEGVRRQVEWQSRL